MNESFNLVIGSMHIDDSTHATIIVWHWHFSQNPPTEFEYNKLGNFSRGDVQITVWYRVSIERVPDVQTGKNLCREFLDTHKRYKLYAGSR